MDVSGRVKGKRLSDDAQVALYLPCDATMRHYIKTATCVAIWWFFFFFLRGYDAKVDSRWGASL